jgi:hypothetical protein
MFLDETSPHDWTHEMNVVPDEFLPSFDPSHDSQIRLMDTAEEGIHSSNSLPTYGSNDAIQMYP